MSDKSFGDYTNRNVVKNPLLSSAVVGLSIEDLTQNAVLLPAIPSQELITRLDQNNENQMRTLHSDHDSSNLPAGDTSFNPTNFNTPNTNQNLSDTNKHVYTNFPNTSLSKASTKSDDDFDVNEYFARLQGTRYISAPLNSNIKDDQNANLQAEDNLEEINLNEPDKAQVDEVQQSITADIAQNFSQLPTVLPQVASAVFSSFSNMLSLKSREQTPDEKPQGYQEAHVRTDVPLEVPEVPMHVAPPPLKEPPTAGIVSNYRITTKKKVYAQIPGLSSGDSHVQFNPQTNTAPPYFAEANVADAFAANVQQPGSKIDNVSIGFDDQYSVLTAHNVTESQNVNIEKVFEERKNTFNVINPIAIEDNDKNKILSNTKVPSLVSEALQPIFKETENSLLQTSTQQPILAPQNPLPSTSIIPPPPMFSNLPRRDSQTSVGKSLLPPSVARRISANQPIMKPQAPSSMITNQNFFVPKMPSEPNVGPTFGFDSSVEQSYGQSFDLTSNIGSNNTTIQSSNQLQSDVRAQTIPSINMLQPSGSDNERLGATLPIAVDEFKESKLSKESLIPSQKPKLVDSFVSPATFNLPAETVNISSNPLVSHISRQENIAPPAFYNPLQPDFVTSLKKDEHKDVSSDHHSQITQHFGNLPPEPPKPIQEPPKFTGNLNYRMSKKKPQYYSGPIEGVGSISNNTKPIINSVEPSSFQGALFTPDYNISTPSNSLYPDYNINSVQEPTPFDISKPANIEPQPIYGTQPQNDQIQLDYNTAFDLSRPTTDKYEQPQQEFRGFGIIGSLKSKLSSIDINKIQNSVTTFFDPAYNNASIDGTKSENKPYNYQNVPESYTNYPQSEGATTLEVFVPNVNQDQSYSSPYPYQIDHTQPTNQTQQYYPTQDYYGNKNQLQIDPSSNYYPGWYDNYNQQQSQLGHHFHSSANFPQSSVVKDKAIDDTSSKTTGDMKLSSNIPSYLNQDILSQSKNSELQKLKPTVLVPEATSLSTSLFDNQQPTQVEPANKNEKLKSVIYKADQHNVTTEEFKPLQVTSDSTLKNFFDYPKLDLPPEATINTKSNESQTNDGILKSTPYSSFQSIFNNPLPIEKLTIETGLRIDHSRGCYGSDFIGDVPKITQVFTDPSSKGFFDKQTSIVLPFAIKNPDDILIPKSGNSSESMQSKYLEPIEPEVIRIKYNVDKNIQNVFGKKELLKTQTDLIKTTEDFSTIKKPAFKIMPEVILPPIIQTKNIETRENINICSVKRPQDSTDLNPTAFSLFEPSPNISSVPLFNLSSISSIGLSEPIKDVNDVQDIQTKLENVSLFQSTDAEIPSQPTYNLFGNMGGIEIKDDLIDNPVSDLNICETCREVNKPEEKEVDDLTTQLIENITAPIQLANPVEFPVVEDDIDPLDKPDYPNQLTDMSLITENIIESMIIPPPVDLIEDMSANNPILNFGWSTNEAHSSKALLDHDYNFQLDSNSIGFLQDKSLFFENIPTNACDEMKAEYRNSQEETTILTHQMSIPSAPPEEDTKSDESGLDVHSIEQDAKKDFPLYEEFVIEPSETDDDKIEYRERERSSDDPIQDVDTFTNRVERFKKLENTTDPNDNAHEMPKEIKTFDLPTSTSPAITIASYFDTGNYAVENHYKNSITSPSLSTFTTNTTKPMRIPPGFEEEYQRRLSGISSQDLLCAISNQITTYIPDTSKKIFAQVTTNVDDEIICDAKVESMVEQLIEDDDASAKSERLPAFSNLIEPKEEKDEEKVIASIEKPTKEEPKVEPLPDPINFFSSNEESTEESEAYSNFSRLSSYFTTPPKPDHSKSFFELSQSQNHYRHKSNEKTFDSIQNNVKNFFDTTPSNVNTLNIPQNMANMALIRDLASSKNFSPNEDIVKTVNYFTVEYNLNNTNVIKIGEPININNKDNSLNANNYNKSLKSEESCNYEISNCNYRCDMTQITNNTDNSGYKIKKSMDSNSDNRKETNSMDSKKENVGKKSMTVNFCEQSYQEETDDRIVVMSENRASSEYSPVKHHWFYQVDSEEKSIWRGFSVTDSRALENAFNSPDLNEHTLVATDGGRYDVNVMERLKIAVYWDDKPTNVMRCSWFYKGTTDARYVPYSESIAEKLEEEYIHGITTGEWHRRLMLPNNELVVMHGPAVMVHFLQNSANDAFSSSPQSMTRPRVVRRGCIESEIEDTEPSSIDHLLLLCHGVGSACDMRFRPVEEVVDDFRATSLQLIQSHYKNSFDSGVVGRVEVLPISWHSSLHSGQTGVDKRLAAVTLDSIPRLRNFTNDTILDVLFYTSPVFCQTIINTVCSELNRIYSLFKSRNPDFKGGVSLGGHSLGSVILYDLLCHQMPKDVPFSKDKRYVTGPAGTGQPSVKYPSLDFKPDTLYALGSPIAMFNCIRGVESLGQEFCLPTCRNFFNIFHPYDPITYRIEPLINSQLRDVKPFLIPHHKGRKRMHLELKDTMARVGADIKQKLIESIKNTWSSMWKTQPPPDQHLEKVVEEEMEKEELNSETKEEQNQENEVTPDMLGKLNDGRRVDYVLQEAPFEMINEYLFAMRSHVCYWESEDTMLVILKEIYNALGVSPDCSLPQQTMTVQRNRVIQEENDISPTDYPSTSRGSS